MAKTYLLLPFGAKINIDDKSFLYHARGEDLTKAWAQLVKVDIQDLLDKKIPNVLDFKLATGATTKLQLLTDAEPDKYYVRQVYEITKDDNGKIDGIRKLPRASEISIKEKGVNFSAQTSHGVSWHTIASGKISPVRMQEVLERRQEQKEARYNKGVG
jgi:hypothetical protein